MNPLSLTWESMQQYFPTFMYLISQSLRQILYKNCKSIHQLKVLCRRGLKIKGFVLFSPCRLHNSYPKSKCPNVIFSLMFKYQRLNFDFLFNIFVFFDSFFFYLLFMSFHWVTSCECILLLVKARSIHDKAYFQFGNIRVQLYSLTHLTHVCTYAHTHKHPS